MTATHSAQATFERALRFMNNGDPALAAELCRGALEEFPADPGLRTLFGTSLLKQRDFESAERELRLVVEDRPDIAKAHRELGNALIGLRRMNDAIRCFEKVIELMPDNATAHSDLSGVLTKAGRAEDAQLALEESFRLQPERAQIIEAIEHQRAERFKDAERIYRDILRNDPTNANATRLLGSIATELGRYRMATRMLRNAVKLAPNFFGAWTDLARALLECEEFDECREAIDEALRLEPELAYPWMLLGNMFSKAGRYEEAADAFRTALDKQPDHGGSLAGLGNALKTIGQQDEAIERYRAAIRTFPAFGEAWWSLANLKTFRFTDDEVAVMERQVADESLIDETRVNLNYALGKAYEDRGDYADAFFHYSRGAEIRRPHESYDPVQTEYVHDQIIATITPEFIAANEGVGDPDPAPIFIVGLPRSGSTLIEQILASHSQVDGTHELPDLPRVVTSISQQRLGGKTYPLGLAEMSPGQFRDLGQQYLESTRRHRGDNPFFTDKMPNNFASVGLLQLILPNASIVNARRHPLDSCMGSFKQLFYKGQSFTYDLIELGEYYLEYDRLMNWWHEILPGKVLDVHYEQMVGNQEQETRRLISHCGLPWEDACLEFYKTDRAVNTASSEQVRQPIYSKSVNSWRRFEDELQPLIEVLEPLLLKLPKDQQPVCLS
jgi:tetratricopeptide (TPR) repeat protein